MFYKISFEYPEEKKFPPKEGSSIRCRIFFLNLRITFIFKKNRSSKFDGTTFLYKIPYSWLSSGRILENYKTEVVLKTMHY
jgi:hypothetical protein